MGYLENVPLMLRSIAVHKRFQTPHSAPIVDGSRYALQAVDDLALDGGSFLDSLFFLYACGVDDFQAHVLDPRQVFSMMINGDSYEKERTVKRKNGMAGSAFCCAGPNDKLQLLQKLSDTLDSPHLPRGIDSSSIDTLRGKLITQGVEEKKVHTLSNKALLTYAIANEVQFLIAIIHPFWERNGRTSEEAMHLICAKNGVEKKVFWDEIDKRYNPITIERMELIDKLAVALLPDIALRMGLNTDDNSIRVVHDIYRLWYREKANFNGYALKDFLQKHTPLKYFSARTSLLFSKKLMDTYFSAIKAVIEDRIQLINNIPELIKDPITFQLLAHHIQKGRGLDLYKETEEVANDSQNEAVKEWSKMQRSGVQSVMLFGEALQEPANN